MSRNRTVTVEKRGANHGLHLVLTILTAGLWAITGWPIAAMMGRKTKTVTRAPQQVQVAMQQGQFVPQPGAQPYYGQTQQPYPPQQFPPAPQQSYGDPYQRHPQQGWQPPQ
jgi:hypothetical protein